MYCNCEVTENFFFEKFPPTLRESVEFLWKYCSVNREEKIFSWWSVLKANKKSLLSYRKSFLKAYDRWETWCLWPHTTKFHRKRKENDFETMQWFHSIITVVAWDMMKIMQVWNRNSFMNYDKHDLHHEKWWDNRQHDQDIFLITLTSIVSCFLCITNCGS